MAIWGADYAALPNFSDGTEFGKRDLSRMKGSVRPRFSKPDTFLLLASLAAIGFLTLKPTDGPVSSIRLFCVLCGPYGAPDLIGNVLLFLPLGIALGRGRVNLLHSLAIGLALSAGIEAIQTVLPGRNPTLRDMVTNGVGAGLGSALSWYLHEWIRPSTRATHLHWMAVIAFLGAIGLTGALQQFRPVRGNYFVHWSPRQGHLAEWSGSVIEARIGETRVQPGMQSSEVSSALRASLRDSLVVNLLAIQGQPTQGIGGILTLTNERGEEGFLVGLSGHDVVVRANRRSTQLRMRAPTYRYPSALVSVGFGDTVGIQVAAAADGACIRVNGKLNCLGRPAAGSIWTLALSNAGRGLALSRYFDFASTLVLAMPFGLLMWSVNKRNRIGSGASILVGFPAAAWFSGLAMPTVWDWGGVILALMAGALYSRFGPNAGIRDSKK